MDAGHQKAEVDRMYEQLAIWKVISENHAIRYTCVKNIILKKYRVQSTDFFYKSMSNEDYLQFNKQFLELLLENHDSNDVEWFESICEAIENHDSIFQY